jgi:N utilization substance protein B
LFRISDFDIRIFNIMGKRHESREMAVQFLYQWDAGDDNLDEALALFWGHFDEPPDAETRQFAEAMVRGAVEHLAAIDAKIRQFTQHWDFERIAAVDRAILRLGIYEMLFRDDIPPVVSINEAVEIAKKFSTAESGKFVNGILDRICKDLPRPARTAAGGVKKKTP